MKSEMEMRINGQPIRELSFKSLCTLKRSLPSSKMNRKWNEKSELLHDNRFLFIYLFYDD